MDFKLVSEFAPTGDQPQAINELVREAAAGTKHQTLLGVTGSGKTFTIANVIKELKRPTLVLSHNKTLAAQLYGEFKAFFPENAVEYFVSYYDYFQPEAYLPNTDTYIEKDLSINDELEKLRLSATSALLSGRRDVIIVSSVSCLYGIGNPDDFHDTMINVKQGQLSDFFMAVRVSFRMRSKPLIAAMYLSPVAKSKPRFDSSPFNSHAKFAMLARHRGIVLDWQRTLPPFEKTPPNLACILCASRLCSSAPRVVSCPSIPE